MARLILQSTLVLTLLSSSVLAQSAGASCGAGSKCPQDTPCCSTYGQCGVGAYCLGGCDPANSFSLDACVPAPVCKSQTFNFNNNDDIVPNTKYLGDATKADWVSSGEPVNHNGQLWLTMAEGTVGTLVSSTRSMWYGTTKARFSTAAGAGVVTAFIILGGSKDEIDFEFVGIELESAQTNFYSQGITNYNNGQNVTGLEDIHANMHDYEIDWQPDMITWSIDGKQVRTLNREDTWNASASRYSFPQSPGQVQLSLWPAGLPTNGEGTINWGGGLVQWDSQYMVNGYYYAAFDSVEINCYDPPSGANVQGSASYIYTSDAMTNDTVELSDKDTVLSSFLATGLNMTLGDTTASASGSAQTSQANTIPGLSGAGTGSNGQRGDNGTTDSGSGDSGSGSGGNQGTYTATGTGSAATGFVQGDGGMNNGAGAGGSEQVLQGSLFAVVVAIIGLCVL